MPRTVLMIGAGAVSGGWDAVYTALRQLYPGLHPDGCNIAFANLVHRLRWFSHAVQRDPSSKSALENQLRQYEKLKGAIAAELTAAFDAGKLAFLDHGRALLKRLLAESPDLKIITTNWDKTLDGLLAELGAQPDLGRLYLHGIVTHPPTLYLPTEAVDEPYRADSTKREVETLRKSHLLAANWVANCDRLYVYGLSFSPLDPELGMVAVTAFHERKRDCTVEVHDIKPEPVVAHLRFFCEGPHCKSITAVTVPRE